MKTRHIFFQIQPVLGDALNTDVVEVLDLTLVEKELLDSAFKQAKQHLDELREHAASRQVTADGKKLIVTVAPIPTEGSAVYSNLVTTLKQVLGPERYQLFNDVTGDSFDRSFESFGLNTVSYELSLEPISQPGSAPNYAFKQSFKAADGSGSSGWSNGTMDRSSLEKSFPVLAHFFTPDIK